MARTTAGEQVLIEKYIEFPSVGPLEVNGRIDEVELFNRAVPHSQIRAIYRAGRAGKCEPVSGTVTGIKVDEVTCHAGGGKSATAVITDQFWNCTRAGFTFERHKDLQVKIKGTVLSQ